jgi:hypothetical protein
MRIRMFRWSSSTIDRSGPEGDRSSTANCAPSGLFTWKGGQLGSVVSEMKVSFSILTDGHLAREVAAEARVRNACSALVVEFEPLEISISNSEY